MKINATTRKILERLALTAGLCLVVFFVWYSSYRKDRADEIVLKSRYTFSVRIDNQGNLLSGESDSAVDEHSSASDFSSLGLNQIADIWVTQFTNQYTQKYLPWSKALKNVKINSSTTLDEDNETVLVSFSAALQDTTSEYFSSWNGVMDDGRMECEWVVKFDIDNHNDSTATIYVSSIESPEDYGIAQYNQNLKDNVAGNTESPTTASSATLTGYELKSNTLSVTFNDGAKYTTVPVDCANLPMADNSTTQLRDGSYMLSTYKAAFLYGGTTNGSNKTPVTLIYSDDKGANWITCEVDKIYDAAYYYVNFFDENNGVIVIGYAQNSSQEASRIYTTSDGGEDWTAVGSGPATNIIKGVNFIEHDIGFFSYNYVDGMDSNLYVTRDAGKTFSKVMLEAQELDSTAANSSTVADNAATTSAAKDSTENPTEAPGTTSKLEWSDVYKEALVPIFDQDGVLTVYLTQGSKGVYNNGKTAAKYQSTDKGVTWKYIGQLEISSK